MRVFAVSTVLIFFFFVYDSGSYSGSCSACRFVGQTDYDMECDCTTASGGENAAIIELGKFLEHYPDEKES